MKILEHLLVSIRRVVEKRPFFKCCLKFIYRLPQDVYKRQLLSRLYEDFVLGDLSKERYKKMTADYEAEQERLKLEIEVTEEWLETQETMSADVDAFVALTQKYVDVPELTPTIVNEYIKKIEAVSYTHLDVYKRQVLWAVENGITAGTTAATFAPNATDVYKRQAGYLAAA